jgi:hypothetical protein
VLDVVKRLDIEDCGGKCSQCGDVRIMSVTEVYDNVVPNKRIGLRLAWACVTVVLRKNRWMHRK